MIVYKEFLNMETTVITTTRTTTTAADPKSNGRSNKKKNVRYLNMSVHIEVD